MTKAAERAVRAAVVAKGLALVELRPSRTGEPLFALREKDAVLEEGVTLAQVGLHLGVLNELLDGL